MNDLWTVAQQDPAQRRASPTSSSSLPWLPTLPNWTTALSKARAIADPAARLAEITLLANHDRDFIVTGKLDRAAQACLADPQTVSRATGRAARRLALLACIRSNTWDPPYELPLWDVGCHSRCSRRRTDNIDRRSWALHLSLMRFALRWSPCCLTATMLSPR